MCCIIYFWPFAYAFVQILGSPVPDVFATMRRHKLRYITRVLACENHEYTVKMSELAHSFQLSELVAAGCANITSVSATQAASVCPGTKRFWDSKLTEERQWLYSVRPLIFIWGLSVGSRSLWQCDYTKIGVPSFYNNFEIIDVQWMRSPVIRRWQQAVLGAAGIYLYRW